MENLVLMEAKAEVTAVMRDGAELSFSEETGKVENIPFSNWTAKASWDCSRMASTGPNTSTAAWSRSNLTGSS